MSVLQQRIYFNNDDKDVHRLNVFRGLTFSTRSKAPQYTDQYLSALGFNQYTDNQYTENPGGSGGTGGAFGKREPHLPNC